MSAGINTAAAKDIITLKMKAIVCTGKTHNGYVYCLDYNGTFRRTKARMGKII
jgi:hypothetical protein